MSDKQIVSNLYLDLAENETAEIVKKSTEKKPGYALIGNGMTTKHGRTSIDLLQEIADMNSNEKLCFFLIRDSFVYDRYDKRIIYQAKVDLSNLSKSQKSKFSNGYTSLYRKDLIRRVSKGVYMVNPNAIIPKHYEVELVTWNNLKEYNE